MTSVAVAITISIIIAVCWTALMYYVFAHVSLPFVGRYNE